MLTANYSGKFKKDLKLMAKRGLSMQKIYTVMVDLQNEIPLQPKHREHLLTGNFSGFSECHIEPDWLMIYKPDLAAQEIYFARTGSHADLFE